MAKKSKSKLQRSNSFLEALQFCSLVCKKEGTPNETNLLLIDRSCRSFNGIVAASINISEDILAYPNAELITNAIAKCGEHYSITQLDKNKLSIKSDKFRAIVPCLPIDTTPDIRPDPPQAVIDDRFKEALINVSVLATEDAQSVITASVLIAGTSVIATNRAVIMESWHGNDLPYGIAVPKSFTQILSKINKKSTKFGYGQSSCTFYFEDESWIRTQFFAEPWPDVRRILDKPCNLQELPNEFYAAIDAVHPFSPNGDMYFGDNCISSHMDRNLGAHYEINGLVAGSIYSAKWLKIIQPYIEKVDFQKDALIFQGKNVRGCVAGKVADAIENKHNEH